MQSAKDAVSSFLGRGGKEKTDVDEQVNPAVTSETVKPVRHEETTEAIDKEVHKDHYHTTVQPLAHQEVLPETHAHNVAPQVEKRFQHGDTEQDKARVSAELGQFRDTSRTEQTTYSAQAAPAVAGEHIHHHVHETVQPVIHKETIQPEVVHTTVPIHEKHTAPSEHHGMSVLPTKTLDDVKHLGTSLTGGASAHSEYEGLPKSYDPALQKERTPADRDPEKHAGVHDPERTGHPDLLHSPPPAVLAEITGADERQGTGTVTGAAAPTAMPGRDTVEGYQTTSDRDPSFGRTEGGTFTGQGDRLGPQDVTTSTASNLGSSTEFVDPNTRTTRDNFAPSATLNPEPSNLTGGIATDPAQSQQRTTGTDRDREAGKPLSAGLGADDVQHASLQGEDPSLKHDRRLERVTEGRLTGSGADGSHSAVFGLTPDGHKFDDTGRFTGSGAPVPAGRKGDSAADSEDVGSRGVGTGKVAEQMNDPRVAEKGHEGQATYGESRGDAGPKPGAGAF